MSYIVHQRLYFTTYVTTHFDHAVYAYRAGARETLLSSQPLPNRLTLRVHTSMYRVV